MSASSVVRQGVVSFTLSFVAALGVSAQSPTGRPLAIEDYYRVKTVGNPDLSPDGKWVAFTVSTRVEATNDNTSEVWLVRVGRVGARASRQRRRCECRDPRVARRRPPSFLGWWTRVRAPTRRRRRKSRKTPQPGAPVPRAADGVVAGARRTRWGRRGSRDAELRRNHERDRARHAAAEARAGLRIGVRETARGALQGRRVRLDGFPARRRAVPACRIAPTRK